MSRTLFIIAGALSIVAGLMALFDPFGASFAATLIAGWGFLIYAVIQLIAAFRSEGWGGKIWSFLIGVLAILVGIELLANPLEGMITLTMMVAILMIASGLAKLIVSWTIRQTQFFWPVLISGAASLLLGFIIIRHFDAAAMSVLGILLGIELLSNGIASIAFAWMTRDKAA